MAKPLEDRPIADILDYFAGKGLPLTVHSSPPDPLSADRLRTLPRSVRRAIESDESSHWADLGTIAHHYGAGRSEDDAIRSAARRYRIEQAPEDAG